MRKWGGKHHTNWRAVLFSLPSGVCLGVKALQSTAFGITDIFAGSMSPRRCKFSFCVWETHTM